MTMTAQPSDNYWSFSAGVIIILFVLYIVKTGSFGNWVKILLYAPAAAPTVPPQQGAAAPNTVFNHQTGLGAPPVNMDPNQQGFVGPNPGEGVIPGTPAPQGDTGMDPGTYNTLNKPLDPWGWVRKQILFGIGGG